MIRLLIKKQMWELFRSYFVKNNKKRSKNGTILLFVFFIFLMVFVMGGMFGGMAWLTCSALVEARLSWMYFLLFALISILLGTFGSVFNTYSGMYLAKDNDLLLSLPIPVHAILISRILTTYLMVLLYSGIVMVPALIVYQIQYFSPVTLLSSVFFYFLITVFTLSLTLLLGYLVAKISVKLKNKSYLTVFISLVFLGAYYAFFAQSSNVLENFMNNLLVYGNTIKTSISPLYLFGESALGKPVPLLLSAGVILGIFALIWHCISRSFLSISTTIQVSGRIKEKKEVTRVCSVDSALFHKELRKFTSSPTYMLNCGLGIVFFLLLTGALLVKKEILYNLLEQVPVLSSYTGVSILTLFFLIIPMCDMAAPSISLEGKNIWITQSLPVTTWQILKAKIKLQFLLTVLPSTLCIGILSFLFPVSVSMKLLMLVSNAVCVLFFSLFDITVNLHFVNLEWTNELVPIKQGASVLICTLGGFLFGILYAVSYIGFHSLLSPCIYTLLFTLIVALVCLCLTRWLKNSGCRKYQELH